MGCGDGRAGLEGDVVVAAMAAKFDKGGCKSLHVSTQFVAFKQSFPPPPSSSSSSSAGTWHSLIGLNSIRLVVIP
jgi:hypothetical protein